MGSGKELADFFIDGGLVGKILGAKNSDALDEVISNLKKGENKGGKYYLMKYGSPLLKSVLDMATSFGSTFVPDLDNQIWNTEGELTDLLNAYELQLAKWASQSETPELSKALSRLSSQIGQRKEQLASNLRSLSSKRQAMELIQKDEKQYEDLQSKYDRAMNDQQKRQQLASAASNLIANARTNPSYRRVEDVNKLMDSIDPKLGTKTIQPPLVETAMDKLGISNNSRRM